MHHINEENKFFNFLKDNSSFWTSTFFGSTAVILECPLCKESLKTIEPFCVFIAPIPTKSNYQIYYCDYERNEFPKKISLDMYDFEIGRAHV